MSWVVKAFAVVVLNFVQVACGFRFSVGALDSVSEALNDPSLDALELARRALHEVSVARGMSLELARPRDAYFLRGEALLCGESDCCLCSGALLEPAPEILEEAAEAVEKGEGLMVIARKNSSISALCWVSKAHEPNKLKVDWLCQRPQVSISSKSPCKDAAAKSGQLALVGAIVEALSSFNVTTAELAVAGTMGSDTNNAAVGLYCKYCFKYQSRITNLAMENLDLPGTVQIMPQLLANLMPGADKAQGAPLCSCSGQPYPESSLKSGTRHVGHAPSYQVVTGPSHNASHTHFESGDDYWDAYDNDNY